MTSNRPEASRAARRKRDDRSSAELVEAALTLLDRAGALPVPLLTPREAADLIPIGIETVRSWCRSGQLGVYDRRLCCFLIELPALRRHVLKTRGFLSKALRKI